MTATATVHGYIVAFWWVAGIFLFGAIVCGALMRRGPLQGRSPARPRPRPPRPARPPPQAPGYDSTTPVTTPE